MSPGTGLAMREKLLTPPEVAKWLGVLSACVRDHASRK